MPGEFDPLFCSVLSRELYWENKRYKLKRSVNLFLAEESHKRSDKYINTDDVIAFCLYLMNKMRWNVINIR